MCMNEWFNIISLVNAGMKWNISQNFEWNNNNNNKKCYLSKLWKLNSQLKGLNLLSQAIQYYYCFRTQGALYAFINEFRIIFNLGFPNLVFERNKHFDIKPLIELVVGMVSTKL
jgi:hypothetical protein